MNYFEHHIGDYAQATAHLSFVEDAAYHRMMRKYYADEGPLPGDVKTVQRLVGARSAAERKAVETVLREFFTFRDNYWHQSRCDEEIERYLGKKVGADQKRENTAERQRRHRDRRRKLFDELREYDIVPAYETSTTELEAILSRVTSASLGSPVTRDATATHTPVTSNHTKDKELPPAAGTVLPELRDPIFGTGLDFLMRKGIRERAARSFLGLLRKELNDDFAASELLTRAEHQDVSNPQAWLTAAAKARKQHAHPNHVAGRKLSAVEQVEQAIRDRRAAEQGAPAD